MSSTNTISLGTVQSIADPNRRLRARRRSDRLLEKAFEFHIPLIPFTDPLHRIGAFACRKLF